MTWLWTIIILSYKRNNVDSLQNISISPRKSFVTFGWKQVTMSLPSLVISDLPGEAKNGCRVLGAGESPQILGDKFVFFFFTPKIDQTWWRFYRVLWGFSESIQNQRQISSCGGWHILEFVQFHSYDVTKLEGIKLVELKAEMLPHIKRLHKATRSFLLF